jgi:hypothetical protein
VEEVAAKWLLELLDLPRASSVGFTTGATMAAFICLAAARGEVLRRAGHDFDLTAVARRASPRRSEDAYVSNSLPCAFSASARAHQRLPADSEGVLDVEGLTAARRNRGPAIVICQAARSIAAFRSIRRTADPRGPVRGCTSSGAFGLGPAPCQS